MALNSYHWSAEGVRVKFSSGTRTVIGGPFGQAKEIVAGYWILQVKSMDEAADRHASVGLRFVDSTGMPPPAACHW
jgi:hypothetical protein